MPQDLSEALKEATKEVHTQAENAEFMKNFQKGQVTREGFKVCAGGYDRYGCAQGSGLVLLVETGTRDAESPDRYV